jgi:hypothetical protein
MRMKSPRDYWYAFATQAAATTRAIHDDVSMGRCRPHIWMARLQLSSLRRVRSASSGC